jgi:predicted AAA+ superfamily ATPase
VFQREVIGKLEQWSAKPSRKPLILRGARQVGKTTLVEEFSKQFDIYLYLNLEDKRAKSLFEEDFTMDELLSQIFLYCNKPRVKDKKVLLFIDEIQYSPQAVARLRYFYEEAPEIFVIAAGSLLETLISVNISFPVGRVEYLAVRPCSFCEFLVAMGEIELEKAIKRQAISKAIHSKTMSLFNTFTFIGGMPEVVAHFAEYQDFVSLNEIYETLLTSYRDDVEKYAKNDTMKNVIRYILKEGWAFDLQRITLGNFANSPYKAREISEAFRTLEKTMLLELVYPAITTLLPAPADLKRSPKLIWHDVGLVNYAANIQQEVFGSKDIIDAYRGKIAEQVVAQELLSSETRVSAQRAFWVREKKGSDAEVDFIIQYNSKIIPVEVKSGHNAHLRSLHLFMDEAPHDIAVRVWAEPFSIDEVETQKGKKFKLINLPFYYVGEIKNILKEVMV